jgi:hypothetical protein
MSPRTNRARLAAIVVAAVLGVSSVYAQSTVYATARGKKYHTYADCRSIKSSSTVKTLSLEDAQKAGLDLCSICAKRSSSSKGK